MAVAAHIARLRGSTPRPRPGAEAGRTPCLRGCGQEELPHVQGQGQRPRVPGCDSAGTAEKSYPTSEVRGSCRECQAATAQEQPRGATQPPRSGVAAGRSYPPAQGQGQRTGRATPPARSGGCTGAGGPRGAIPRSRSGGAVVGR